MQASIKKLKRNVENTTLQNSAFHIEIDKSGYGYSVTTSGVKRIRELTDTKISLKCSVGTVSVTGNALSLSLYENKTVEISGKVEGVELANTKN